MLHRFNAVARPKAILTTAIATLLSASSVFAQQSLDLTDLPLLAANEPPIIAAPALDPAPAAPSASATVNLIRQLVELGVLPKEKAGSLLKQAEAEAEQVRAQFIAERDAAVQIAVTQTLAAVQANPALVGEPLPKPEESSRITYVPEVVRAQLRDEIKRDLASYRQERALGRHLPAAGLERALPPLRRFPPPRRRRLLPGSERQHRRFPQFQRDQHERAFRHERHRFLAAVECGSGTPAAAAAVAFWHRVAARAGLHRRPPPGHRQHQFAHFHKPGSRQRREWPGRQLQQVRHLGRSRFPEVGARQRGPQPRAHGRPFRQPLFLHGNHLRRGSRLRRPRPSPRATRCTIA